MRLANGPLKAFGMCWAMTTPGVSGGSRTIAQDEATSVVWGMPGEAVALGAAQYVLPLENVAGKILSLADAMDITRDAREA